jgi:hypothetical protein
MSNNTPSQAAVAAGAADPSTTPSPTVTHYQQLAADFSKALDEISALIPQLELTHASTAKFVRAHLNVPMEFLATAVAVVEQVPALVHAGKLDVEAARDTLQFIDAFRPIADKVNAFAKSLNDTMNSRRATLAADSLQIYAIAKGLARDPNSAKVGALVANLKRDLGRRGRPKATTATTAKKPPIVIGEVPEKGGVKKAA